MLNSPRFDGRFLVVWSTVTAIGYALGWYGGFVFGHLVGEVAVAVGVGLSVGICQWSILRHRLPDASYWITSTLIGMATASVVRLGLWQIAGLPIDASWPNGMLTNMAAYFVGGSLIGFLQTNRWPTLEQRAPWKWVIVSGVAWALSILGIGIPPDMSVSPDLPVAFVLLRNGILPPAVAGAILGSVTGIGFLQRSRLAGARLAKNENAAS